ncbi:hypothetical protein [Sphingomonas crusticola]|nr:hypothetical protein [Sphingomonas crusticola]
MASQPPSPEIPTDLPIDEPVPTPVDPIPPVPSDPVINGAAGSSLIEGP